MEPGVRAGGTCTMPLAGGSSGLHSITAMRLLNTCALLPWQQYSKQEH